jgi:hypothetical protein
MYDTLERYLHEVDDYLFVKQGSKEILAEIRAHILEKAENAPGGVTEDSVRAALAEYGRPREVAAKYMEGYDIISPTFRKVLFRYTWVLFGYHLILSIIALVTRTGMVVIPFFYIPKMTNWSSLFYFPMIFFYDFGLVALFLYLMTQRRRDVRLPWPGFLRSDAPSLGFGRPKRGVLTGLALLLAGALYLLVRYHTIIFYGSSRGSGSLMAPASSLFFSSLLVAAIACHVAAYAIRFLFNSAWVNFARDVVVLFILWFIWNSPVKPEYVPARGVNLSLVGGVFILVLTVLAAARFLRSILRVRREMSLQ